MSGKIVDVSYYRLVNEKELKDGSVVSTEVLLRFLPEKQKGLFLVETVDTFDFKKIFPVKKSELQFVEIRKEFWSDEVTEQHYRELTENWYKT
jgi:hypothetical protein